MLRASADVQRRIYALMVLMKAADDRLSKGIGNAPIYDWIIGSEEGQLNIRKLRTTLTRLPRNLTGKDVNALDKRLGALMARPQMPKGAIPKNMRPARGASRQQRQR